MNITIALHRSNDLNHPVRQISLPSMSFDILIVWDLVQRACACVKSAANNFIVRLGCPNNYQTIFMR